MFGVGMGGSTALKNLNSGWQVGGTFFQCLLYLRDIIQVWGTTTTPVSKRNASISSAASASDLSPQGEGGYRGNLGESWSAPRPSSGTWDEVSGSPQKKEFSQLVSEFSYDACMSMSIFAGH
jgi:hypothetical protein